MNLTVELVAALVAVAAACIGIWTNVRNNRKGSVSEQAEQIGNSVSMRASLSSISDDVKEIKADLKQLNAINTDHEIRLRELERDRERQVQK